MSGLVNDGYVDLQINGYAGVDFNDPATTPEQLCFAAQRMRDDSVEWALPTVITASADDMARCIRNIAQVVKHDEVASSVYQGLHIEGPFLSPERGFIGAHPVKHAAQSDLKLLEHLVEAADGLTRLVTLAPEIDLDGRLTQFCVERGVQVAAGHTDATLEDLDRCVASGLSMFTHLSNGMPRLMDRHDNIIYRVLSRSDNLRITVIADGFHVPQLLFGVFLKSIPSNRIAVVSDAISAATLQPGVYRLGGRSVRVGDDKAARDSSGEHFVGSAASMKDADRWLADSMGLDYSTRRTLLRDNAISWFAV